MRPIVIMLALVIDKDESKVRIDDVVLDDAKVIEKEQRKTTSEEDEDSLHYFDLFPFR